MKKILAVLTALFLVLLAVPAQANQVGTADDPIVVTDASLVPNDATKVYNEETCETAYLWSYTKPGSEGVTHQEYRYVRINDGHEVTPLYDWTRQEKRSATNTYTPGKDKVDKVEEYRYSKVIPGQEETKTEYCKYNKTKDYWTVEHKKVRSSNEWSTKEVTWLKANATKIGSGADNDSEWQLNDSVVNNAKINPTTLPQQTWTRLPNGLGAYRGPSSDDVEYFITNTEVVFLEPSSGWYQGPFKKTLYYTGGVPSTKPGDAIFVKSGEGPQGWTKFDCEKRGNGDGTPDVTVYYPNNYPETDEWTTEVKTKPWELDEQRVQPGTDIPATKGSWSGWDPQLDFANGWQPAAPPVPDVEEGSATLPPVEWEQTRSQTVTSATKPEGEGWTQGEQNGWETTPVEPYKEYYVEGSDPSPNSEDASWVRVEPAGGWTQFEERTVVDIEPAPEQIIYYVYLDGNVCPTPTPTPTPTESTPTPTPTESTPTPTPTESTPTPTPTESTPTVTATPTPEAPSELAHTGNNAIVLLAGLVGLVLFVVGGVALAASRK